MSHPLVDHLVVKNNFFNNPAKVYQLSLQQKYERAVNFPGNRTENLLQSKDFMTKEFAIYFAKKIGREIFPGISQFVTHISFHVNDLYNDEAANEGWIHADDVRLAGLVYLNPTERNLSSGTSIFYKITDGEFNKDDFSSRKDFNLTANVTEEYKKELAENHKHFEETIRVGNVFNRLVAYDAKLYHRPNNFRTLSGEPRRSLLFFIDQYQYQYPDIPNTSKWIDQ